MIVLAVGGRAHADIITYKQGSPTPFIGGTYAGTQDTMIITQGGSEEDNFGGRGNMEVGTINSGSGVRHGLVRFNITSLNGQFSTINSVTLRFYVDFDEATVGNIQLFRLAAANSGWIEGINTSATGTPDFGESTWAQRVYGSQNWAGSPGASTAGTDYLTTALASPTLTTSTPAGTAFDFVFNDVSFIADWAAGNNPGLFLQLSTESALGNNRIAFITRDNPTASLRPELIIDYAAIPEPGSLILVGLAAIGIGLMAWRRRRGIVWA